jgi:hypothetical protein
LALSEALSLCKCGLRTLLHLKLAILVPKARLFTLLAGKCSQQIMFSD